MFTSLDAKVRDNGCEISKCGISRALVASLDNILNLIGCPSIELLESLKTVVALAGMCM